MTDPWAVPMLNIEKTSYTVREILEWNAAELLQLAPDFQRGQVWKRPARAFLIDTILRGYPIPPIHIRFVPRSDGKLLRQVIDGQQRMLSVLEYCQGKFGLARSQVRESELPPWAGLKYSQLPIELRDRILDYSFRCEVYKGSIDDELIREIFARINIYSVSLSQQELRNGRYFGEFKQCVYRLKQEHREFWRASKVFGEAALTRMLDAEFVSEALVVQLAGMQDKKGNLDSFYLRYDASWGDVQEHEDRFRTVIDGIRYAVGDILPETRFSRIALFYTLFCVVYHRLYGIDQRVPEGEATFPESPVAPLEDAATERLRLAVQNLSEYLDAKSDSGGLNEEAQGEQDIESTDDDGGSAVLEMFADAAASQTDNIRPRLRRFQALWELADLSTP